ncbi:MAG: beta-galactosidase [Lactobacillaceae bacterium]|jgi:beta-galactosidase|nr:beta-galactosidase [Lactobacillaceae bacterium]
MTKQVDVQNFLHGGDYNPDQWLDRPDIIDHDFDLFEQARINNYTLGIFSWATLEPVEGEFDFTWLDEIWERIAKTDGKVILATPSGARPRWLAEKYPEVLRVNERGERNLFGERHNHCYTSPIYREKVRIINTKLAERYGAKAELILWHISNEFGGQCHCELCQGAFRKWLQNKYQTLDNLNQKYWNGFWAHTYTDWNQIHSPSSLGDENVLSLNLDWRRFVSDQTIDFYEAETTPLKAITPNIPITTNFMGGNPPDSHVFYDLDYHEFAKHIDVISWDSYPNWANDYESTQDLAIKTALMNDVMRSLKHKNYLIMESTPTQVNWHPVNRAKRPGMHEMACLQEVAHGADAINYFQLHQSRGASEMFHGAVITHNLSNQTRGFQDVATVGKDLQLIAAAKDTTYQTAKVAIVYDYANMWALDDARAYANETKKYWQTLQQHYRYFWEHDIPVELVSVKDDLTAYALVIDPMHYLMADEFSQKLRAYVEQGGTLVGTYITGVVDENNLAYLGGWPTNLQAVYGIAFTETDILYPTQANQLLFGGESYAVTDYCDLLTVTTAEVQGVYGADFYADTAAITKNNYGTGTAYYIAARTDNAFLDDFYAQITQTLTLTVPLPLQKTTTNVSIQVRENTTTRYYFVINFSSEPAKVQVQQELQDLLAATTQSAGEIQLGAYGVKVFAQPINQ